MCCIADLSQMASIPSVVGQALANFERIDNLLLVQVEDDLLE